MKILFCFTFRIKDNINTSTNPLPLVSPNLAQYEISFFIILLSTEILHPHRKRKTKSFFWIAIFRNLNLLSIHTLQYSSLQLHISNFENQVGFYSSGFAQLSPCDFQCRCPLLGRNSQTLCFK